MFLTLSVGFLVGILSFVYLIFRGIECAFFGNYLDGKFIFTLLTFVSDLIFLIKYSCKVSGSNVSYSGCQNRFNSILSVN